MTVTTGTIAMLTRRRLSRMGNPSWSVELADGRKFETVTDGQVGYYIDNGEFRQSPVELTIESGKITKVEVVK